jgi:hypothetical protein
MIGYEVGFKSGGGWRVTQAIRIGGRAPMVGDGCRKTNGIIKGL